MPAVRLSISPFDGSLLCDRDVDETLELEGLSDEPSKPTEIGLVSTLVLFFGARAALVVVAAGRVFLTTTGGIEWPRELIEESGLTLAELGGRIGLVDDIDGALPWTLDLSVGNAGVSADTEPVFEARLNRRADCFVG